MSQRMVQLARQNAEKTSMRVLQRVAQITNSEVATKAESIPSYKQTVDADNDSVDREVHSYFEKLNEHETRMSTHLAHLSPAFIKNPTINFAALKSMAKRLEPEVKSASFWLKMIEREEARVANAKESDFDDPMAEDALVNMLVPIQRQWNDAIAEADVMAETGRMRIAELEASIAHTDTMIANIDNLTIYDIEKDHPDWAAKANDNIRHHRWNLVEDEQ